MTQKERVERLEGNVASLTATCEELKNTLKILTINTTKTFETVIATVESIVLLMRE